MQARVRRRPAPTPGHRSSGPVGAGSPRRARARHLVTPSRRAGGDGPGGPPSACSAGPEPSVATCRAIRSSSPWSLPGLASNTAATECSAATPSIADFAISSPRGSPARARTAPRPTRPRATRDWRGRHRDHAVVTDPDSLIEPRHGWPAGTVGHRHRRVQGGDVHAGSGCSLTSQSAVTSIASSSRARESKLWSEPVTV